MRGQPAPGEHFDSEEVHPCEHFHVGPDELIPAGALTAFRRRLDPVTAQNIPNRPIGDFVVQTFQCARDAVVASAPIFSGESDDQRFYLGGYTRPPRV